MTTDPAIAELASSLSVEETPVKLRCATCSQIAYNALRLPCCEQNICETCYNELEDVCQVCHHEPLEKSLCTPNKSLRTTTKVFLKRKLLERAKEQKKAEVGVAPAPEEPSAAASQPEQPALPAQEATAQAQGQDGTQGEAIPNNITSASLQPSPANDDQAEGHRADDRKPTTAGEGEGGETGSSTEAPVNEPTDADATMGDSGAQNMNPMAAMNGMNFPMNMNPMMAMNGMPNMMGMGMDPMMMNAMANSMFGGFGGPNMGMTGMNGMSNMGMGQFGGPWMNGQESFNADGQGNGSFGANGGYNMPSHQGSFNQQYSHNDFQNGYNRRGFYPRGRGRRGGFYGGPGRYQQGYGYQGNQEGYQQGNYANDAQHQGLNAQYGGAEDQAANGAGAGTESHVHDNERNADAEATEANQTGSGHLSGESQAQDKDHTAAGNGDADISGNAGQNAEQSSGDDGKPLPIQTFISDEPRPRVDPLGPNVPRGPAAQFPGSRGYRGGPMLAPGQQAPIEPKAIGVPGAPTGPRALRVGLPNTGRSGIELSRRGGVTGGQAGAPQDSRSPPPDQDIRRSRSRSRSEPRQQDAYNADQPQEPRSHSRDSHQNERYDREELNQPKNDSAYDDRQYRDPREQADHQESREAPKSSRRSHRDSQRERDSSRDRRRRERSYEQDAYGESTRERPDDRNHDRDRNRNRDSERTRDSDRHRRHRRRSRSRSPGHRSVVPTPTSATAPTFPRSDEGSRKRERDPDGEEENRPKRDRGRKERKRSRRERSYSRERSSKHQASSREASKMSTPITPGFPPPKRRDSGIVDEGFRPPSGPAAKHIPTGPRADSGRSSRDASHRPHHRRENSNQDEVAKGSSRASEKDPHTLEREARDRERLMKEMQRRATLDGSKRKGSEHRRRGHVKYEGEDVDDADRVEREREGHRWR